MLCTWCSDSDSFQVTLSHLRKKCFATPPMQKGGQRSLDCGPSLGFLQRPSRVCARRGQRLRWWVRLDLLERDRLWVTPSHFPKKCFATRPNQTDVPRVVDCGPTLGLLQRPSRGLPGGVDEYQTGTFSHFWLPNRRVPVVTRPVVGVSLAGRLTCLL